MILKYNPLLIKSNVGDGHVGHVNGDMRVNDPPLMKTLCYMMPHPGVEALFVIQKQD